MTSQTAVHASNGSAMNLSPPERDALTERVRAAVEGPADETPQQLIARVEHIPRSSLERMADDMPWIGINCRDSAWSSMNGGTEAIRNTIMAKLAEALVPEPFPDARGAAPVVVEAPVDEGTGAPKAAKPRGKRKAQGKKRGQPKGTHPVARTPQNLAPLSQQYQQVILALKKQRASADEGARNLLDAAIHAAEQNDRVALEDIRTRVGTNNTNMRMFGMLWAALEDRDTRWAMLLEEAAKGSDPRASFLEGRSLFRDSVARIRGRVASADPDVVVESEHDASDQPGN